jgi:hypothetical protein
MRYILPFCALLLAGSFSAPAAVDSGLIGLVPPGAKMVGAIDFERARNSPFGQFMLSKMKMDDVHFQEFIAQTGFDPRRDLQAVVFASPASAGDQAPSKFAILARGNFNASKIKATALAKGAVVQPYQGVDLLVPKSGAQQSGFAFLDGGVAVMGDLVTLQQIIANRGVPSTLDPQLQQQISSVGAANDAWFVSEMSGSFLAHQLSQQTKQPMQHAQALQSVLGATGGILFGDPVQLSFDATTRSPKDATSLADVVRFAASMVEMQRQNDPRADILASALDNMALATDGDSLHLAISLSEKNLEQLAEAAPKAAVHARH